MNKCLAITLALICLPVFGFAQDDVQPIIYNREVIKLIPKPETKVLPDPLPAPKPALPEPTKKGQLLTKADEKKQKELKIIAPPPGEETPPPPPPRVPIDFTVDVKEPNFLTQDDFITHTNFGEHEGLFILIDPPASASVAATRMVGTSDVLFINEDGLITRIAPKLNPATLTEPVSSGGTVRGFLFIKSGGAEQDRIAPGDRFEGMYFKTHPVILQ